MAKTRQVQPWWLSDLSETCPTCSQSYAYHTEVRCVDCDGPMCPICVQVTRRSNCREVIVLIASVLSAKTWRERFPDNDSARDLERSTKNRLN